MKTGDTVRVRRAGTKNWGEGKVLLCSENGKSLLLVGEALPDPEGGIVLHPDYGKTLALLWTWSHYQELITATRFDVEPI